MKSFFQFREEQSYATSRVAESRDYPAHHDVMTHDTHGDSGKTIPNSDIRHMKNNKPKHSFKDTYGRDHHVWHHPAGHTLHSVDDPHGTQDSRYKGHLNPKHIERDEKKYG